MSWFKRWRQKRNIIINNLKKCNWHDCWSPADKEYCDEHRILCSVCNCADSSLIVNINCCKECYENITNHTYIVKADFCSSGIYKAKTIYDYEMVNYSNLNLPDYLIMQFEQWIKYFDNWDKDLNEPKFNYSRLNLEGVDLASSLQKFLNKNGKKAKVFYHVLTN